VVAVHVVVALLMLLGLAGAVLPALPGAPLILLGAAVHALATGFTPIGWGRLAILAGLAALAYAGAHVGSAVGTRRYGGSRWAIAGALLGALAGLFLGPLGLLVGPVVGAVAAELAHSRDLRHSIRTGVGAGLGLLAGTVAHFALALTMVALFLWWLWRG
jgi:hypothetical protein